MYSRFLQSACQKKPAGRAFHSFFMRREKLVEKGRVIHCSSLDHAALCNTVVSVVQTLFTSIEGSKERFNFYFVIPTAVIKTINNG